MNGLCANQAEISEVEVLHYTSGLRNKLSNNQLRRPGNNSYDYCSHEIRCWETIVLLVKGENLSHNVVQLT